MKQTPRHHRPMWSYGKKRPALLIRLLLLVVLTTLAVPALCFFGSQASLPSTTSPFLLRTRINDEVVDSKRNTAHRSFFQLHPFRLLYEQDGRDSTRLLGTRSGQISDSLKDSTALVDDHGKIDAANDISRSATTTRRHVLVSAISASIAMFAPVNSATAASASDDDVFTILKKNNSNNPTKNAKKNIDIPQPCNACGCSSSFDHHTMVYLNADEYNNTCNSIYINGTRSIVPGTYTEAPTSNGTTVILKDLDNDSMQGDGIHIYVAHGSGNNNNHVEIEITDGGDGVYVYIAEGADNVNNTVKLKLIADS